MFGSQNTVYKWSIPDSGSALASGDYYVRYRPGEFVKAPPGTKFFVFASLEYAEEFVQEEHSSANLESHRKRAGPPARRIGDPKYSCEMQDFWRIHNVGRSFGFLVGHRTPRGTLWADELRLDECISSHPVVMDFVPLRTEPMFHARLRT